LVLFNTRVLATIALENLDDRIADGSITNEGNGV
jgi:hypothetical protein